MELFSCWFLSVPREQPEAPSVPPGQPTQVAVVYALVHCLPPPPPPQVCLEFPAQQKLFIMQVLEWTEWDIALFECNTKCLVVLSSPDNYPQHVQLW